MEIVEYCIYCIWNGGKPFYLKTYDNIFEAKKDLYEMIELERIRNRIYYVDNDFFENEYSCNFNSKVYCIKQRKVSEWIKYTEKETHMKKFFLIKN